MQERRACIGELVQIDGLLNKWFEELTSAGILLVFIEDVIGELEDLDFTKSEHLFSYAYSPKNDFKHHNKPVALYSDRDSDYCLGQQQISAQNVRHRSIWMCYSRIGYLPQPFLLKNHKLKGVWSV